jgi:thiamine-monophosphate kinase
MAGFDEMKLRDASEDRFLEILLADLPLGQNTLVGPGDDCAVVQGLGIRGKLLLKTDCVVEGVHYLPEDDPQKVGWKALCRPLSDVAAMGGEPLHAMVSIMSPEDRTIAYWRSIYKGLSKAAGRLSRIVGVRPRARSVWQYPFR